MTPTRLLLLAVAVAVAACSHQVQSPPLHVSSVTPTLVCNAQLSTEVTVRGAGFTPMPVDTLTKSPHLVLPKVELARTKDLAGAAATGSVKIPDDAKAPASSQLKWVSAAELRFEVTSGLALPAGLFDLHVTNPDGTHASVLSGALAAVPPPTISAVVPDVVCDAEEDQTVTLNGTGLLQVGDAMPVLHAGDADLTATSVGSCTAVPGTHAEGAAQSCLTATFVIPKGTLDAGNFALTVTNPAPAGCATTDPVQLTVVPPPAVASVAPNPACDAQADRTFDVTGTGFLKLGSALPAVTFGAAALTPTGADDCTPIEGATPSEGAAEECTTLHVTLPLASLDPGTFPVVVTNPPPADCHSLETVSVQIAPPPTIASTTPATLCMGGGQLVVNGSGFLPGAKVSLVGDDSSKVDASEVSVDTAGASATATFGEVGAPGTSYHVAVDDEDGCAVDAPSATVTVVTGPVAFYADPPVVYDGINTRVTIYVTTLEQPLAADAVTLTFAGAGGPATTLSWTAVAGHPNRVQVVVPAGQAAGSYDLHLVDHTGCPTVLPNAVQVIHDLTVPLASVVPPFGWTKTETDLTLLRDTSAVAPMDKPFIATPRLFLNPSNASSTDVAIALSSVSFLNGDTLTAVVPPNEPANTYDLVVVNSDGTVGLLKNAFTLADVAPPVVSSVTPSSIVGATGQAVVVAGTHFAGSTVSAACVDANGAALAAPPVTGATASCDASASCTQSATIDGSALPAGAVCVVRVTNANGAYFDYSAVGVTNSSLNLPAPHAGTAMTTARRALSAASGNATDAARFVYALGGDAGAADEASPFDSVEFAPVDLFGHMGAWQAASAKLSTPRSFAASTRIGRYVYVAGGFDGAAPLKSAERAMILNPLEVPSLDVDDIVPADQGLDAGDFSYRVSAVFGASDPDNPNGESLPSDAIVVRVPSLQGKKMQVVLVWTPPKDVAGAPLPNVVGYRVYRTPEPGVTNEVLLAEVDATSTRFTDDGSHAPGTDAPLALGSLGRFTALPNLAFAREGAAGASAVDPLDPTKFYFYALDGLGAGGSALASYEYLPVRILPNGHQPLPSSWTTGLASSSQARWQLGAWVADRTVSSTIPSGATYVYLGGGLTESGSAAPTVEAGEVLSGGDLGLLNAAPKDFSSSSAGYGVCAANGQLFAFGGAGGAPSSGAKSASLTNPPPSLANNSWNSEGITLTEPRYLMGSAVQSAFIFLVGGQTTSAASATTELVIW